MTPLSCPEYIRRIEDLRWVSTSFAWWKSDMQFYTPSKRIQQHCHASWQYNMRCTRNHRPSQRHSCRNHCHYRCQMSWISFHFDHLERTSAWCHWYPGKTGQVDGIFIRFRVQYEPGIFNWQPFSIGDQHLNAETCRRWFGQLIHLLQTQPKVAVEWAKSRLELGPWQIETREVDPLLHDNPVVDRCDRGGLWKCWNRQVDRLVCYRIT